MQILTIFTALLSTAVAAFLPRSPSRRSFAGGCLEPSEGFLNVSAQMNGIAMAQQGAVSGDWEMATIETWMHIIHAKDGRKTGSVTIKNPTIFAQIDLLNTAFASAGFQFRLKGITRTFDDDLSTKNDTQNEDAILEAGVVLRKGGWKTLNVYVVEDMGTGVGGVCTFLPWEAFNELQYFEVDPVGDGCMVMWDNLPGHIPTHEIGHWLGLLHTFSSTCSPVDTIGSGDFVHDTPVHLIPPAESFGECGQKDTCPELPGLDSVGNYMNYEAGSCMMGDFTWGQANRMRLWWDARFRAMSPA